MQDKQYEAIRKRVALRLVLQGAFFLNLIFFALVLLLLLRSGAGIMGTAFFVLIWGAGLLLHAALAFNLLGRLIDRETRRELERAGLAEKPKRHRLELGEDGELVDIVDEWEDEKEKGHANG
jgi:hypothetical protein